MKGKHPFNVVNLMELVGYKPSDMLPAFPGKDQAYLDQLLLDTALMLSRPVVPYGLLGIHPCRSRYFNITEHGFRSSGRDQPWPPKPEKINIFFFGGSSTLGAVVEDHQAVPPQLQKHLEEKGIGCEVYNFGCGSYAIRHEALRFLNLLDQGFAPDYALFLDGTNDSCYATGNPDLVNFLDAAYQQEKRRRKQPWIKTLTEFLMNRPLRLPTGLKPDLLAKYPEVATLTSDAGISFMLQVSNRQLAPSEMGKAHEVVARAVWENYLDSVAIIRALGARRKTRTFFFWQPTSLYMTGQKQRILDRLAYGFRFFAFISATYHWLHANDFPLLKGSSDFFDLSGLGTSLEGVLYSDMGHYTPIFADRIGEEISGYLQRSFPPIVRQ